jgi:hypothetical protein
MNVSASSKILTMLVVACAACACTPAVKEAPEREQVREQEREQPTFQETKKYKPTGSHIVERSDGKRSSKNSSGEPVQDLKNAPAVTVIPNQPPK